MDDKRIRTAIVNAVHAGRLARNWTVSDLAKKIGRGFGDVSLFEAGRIFDLNDVRNLANTLEIKASDIATQTTGERVRVARYLAGLNQTQTADRTGLTILRIDLSEVERDVKSIKTLADNQVETLAKLLHVSVEWLEELEPKQTEMPLLGANAKKASNNPQGGECLPDSTTYAVRSYIGETIKSARQAALITAEELAAGVGISATTVDTMERGTTIIKPKLIVAAMNLLGIDRSGLLKGFSDKSSKWGERITIAQLTQECTTSELAKKYHFSLSMLEKWKRSERFPNPSQFKSLENAFGVSAEWLETGNGEPIPEKVEQIATVSAEPVKSEPTIVEPERKHTELFDITVATERNAAGTTFKALSYDEFLTMLKLAKKADNIAFVELHE